MILNTSINNKENINYNNIEQNELKFIKNLEPILFVNQDNLKQLLCPLCQGILYEPTVLSNTNNIICCKNCQEKYSENKENIYPNKGNKKINNKKAEEIKIIKNKINNLEMKCKNYKEGCTWKGKYSEYNEHLNECLKEQMYCIFYGCNEKILRENLEKHLNQCKFRIYICDRCGPISFPPEGQNHEDVCPKKEIECPNKCGELFERSNLNKHLKEYCPLYTIKCPFEKLGCKDLFIRKNYDKKLKLNDNKHMMLFINDYLEFKQNFINNNFSQIKNDINEKSKSNENNNLNKPQIKVENINKENNNINQDRLNKKIEKKNIKQLFTVKKETNTEIHNSIQLGKVTMPQRKLNIKNESSITLNNNNININNNTINKKNNNCNNEINTVIINKNYYLKEKENENEIIKNNYLNHKRRKSKRIKKNSLKKNYNPIEEIIEIKDRRERYKQETEDESNTKIKEEKSKYTKQNKNYPILSIKENDSQNDNDDDEDDNKNMDINSNNSNSNILSKILAIDDKDIHNPFEKNKYFFVFVDESRYVKMNNKGTFIIKYLILEDNDWLSFGLCDKKIVEDNKFAFKVENNGCYVISTDNMIWHCSDENQRKKLVCPKGINLIGEKNNVIECRYTPNDGKLLFFINNILYGELSNVKPIKSDYLTPCLICFKNSAVKTTFDYPK